MPLLANLCAPNRPPVAIARKSASSARERWCGSSQRRPGQLREELLGQQVGVLGEEAEDQAVKEPGDAEALALGDADFGAGVRVRQFGAFALVQGAGDLGELFRQLLGDLGGGALRLEVFGSLESGAEPAPALRAVNLVIGEKSCRRLGSASTGVGWPREAAKVDEVNAP